MEKPSRFVLPASLTIENAEVIAEALRQLTFVQKAELEVDASGVDTITTPGLQLLVSVDKTLLALGGRMRITGAGETFNRALRDTGLEGLLTPTEEEE